MAEDVEVIVVCAYFEAPIPDSVPLVHDLFHLAGRGVYLERGEA